MAHSEPIVTLVSDGFDSMQARTYAVSVTKQSPSDKYAVLAGVDTTATAINWNGHMSSSCQSGK